MRIVFVVNSMPKAAGVTTFCTGVLNGLVSQGANVCLALNVGAMKTDGIGLLKEVQVISIGGLIKSIIRDEATIVHINGLWSGALIRVSDWAHRVGASVCWSPHGMLMPSAMNVKRIKKYIAWNLYQKRHFNRASIIHVTTKLEKDQLSKFGVYERVVTIPLGVNTKLYRKSNVFHENSVRRLLFVGRVEPIKGLASLIEAISKIFYENGFRGNDGKEWRLRIVGPDNSGYLEFLTKQCLCMGVEKFVEFIGPRYGRELVDEYLNSDAVILPSISENFGATILEGMAAGKPVIATKGTPWECLESEHCGYWVDNSPTALKEAIINVMNLSSEDRQGMGLNGQAFAIREYDWQSISRKFMDIYEDIR